LARKFHASSLAQTQRVLFSRREKAEPFLADGLLQESQIVQLTDQSTKLAMRSRPEARQETGIEGSPVFLWYSNLEPERDPMTAVLGFEKLLQEWNKAQLYMYYGGDELLTQLRAYVIANPALIGRIHFRSRAFSQPPESVFNSADFLLQTDLLANNGHAVIDAMACGVIPVVSDTTQFRALVDNGRCGFLFPPGDAKALAKQLLKFSPGKISGRAALVHAWFEAAYSYEAMAGLLLDVYAEAIGERQAQLRALNEPAPEGSS
jgi:glycosyltransferase involved in cell wall biosynthesis